jgi:hypothetical protein
MKNYYFLLIILLWSCTKEDGISPYAGVWLPAEYHNVTYKGYFNGSNSDMRKFYYKQNNQLLVCVVDGVHSHGLDIVKDIPVEQHEGHVEFTSFIRTSSTCRNIDVYKWYSCRIVNDTLMELGSYKVYDDKGNMIGSGTFEGKYIKQ